MEAELTNDGESKAPLGFSLEERIMMRRRKQSQSRDKGLLPVQGKSLLTLVGCLLLAFIWSVPSSAQQKGQWVPGQSGLNAGVIPDSGVTYANMAFYYSASQLNGPNGNPLQGITGTYSFWADENIFYYVPSHKFLGGYFMPYVVLTGASGSVVADLPDIPGVILSAGGSGFADMYVQPLNLGWHLKRADVNVGYAFVAPTGRFTAGATNNVGSGYWGNNITSGTTFYITKNKATTANLATDWEIHGQKSGTQETPGQAFTDEWGFGQILPLKKDLSQLLQVGLVGYDQFQVTANGGTGVVGGLPIPARLIPYYSVHSVGGQINYIAPAKNLVFFLKGYDEYRALARVEGHTIVFGGSWTWGFPKAKTPKT